MRLQRLTLLLLPLLFLCSGYSVFGVATRGDLEEQQRIADARLQEMRTENRILRDRLERLDATLDRVGASLQTVESVVEDIDTQAARQLKQVWSQTGDLQVRMAAVEDHFGSTTIAADSLRQGIDLAGRTALAAREEVQSVAQGLDSVARRADDAQTRSDALLRAWLEQLRGERAQLAARLEMLDASVRQWEAEAQSIASSEVSLRSPLLEPAREPQDVPANEEP